MIKVSVIVPVYKVPLKYLRACLDSLTAQTLQECEFIVVSDGAPEAECAICAEYAGKDSRLKFFRREHAGVSATRNYGIEQTQGEYITFVDADDTLFSKNILYHAHKTSKKNNSEISLFSWIQNNEIPQIIWDHDIANLSSHEIRICLEQNIHIKNPTFSAVMGAKLYKRDFIIKNKILFNEQCVIGEDRIFNFKAFSLASRIAYSQAIFYNYVINRESATQKPRPDIIPTCLNYIEELGKISEKSFTPLIGLETITMFFSSWETFYMHDLKKENFFQRMHDLCTYAKSSKFQKLVTEIDTSNLSLIAKIESLLLQHKITFWIYLHGFKHLIMGS